MVRSVWHFIIALMFSSGRLLVADEQSCPSEQMTSRLHFKVDIVAPSSKNDHSPLPDTWKPGWWPWVIPDWDFYRSDLVWENGSQSYPKSGKGIADSGVHAALTCHYEGIMTLHVAGMRRYLAGGIQPHKQPIYEPICNSWVAGSDFPNNPASDLLLSFYDLPAGCYRLTSYHNCFNGRRFGDNPTGVEYSEARMPEPPMPSIKVYSMKKVVTNYFERPLATRTLPKGKPYGTSLEKIMVPGKQGSGDVKQTVHAENVRVQQEETDANLKPSVVEFTTDGSPLVVVYSGGAGKRDDLRPHRHGGYAVLNAFELIQLAE